jgi:Beta-lactamase class C and other penicillin binding proteins
MSAEGICYGGFGLHVTTDDIARLGTLYLNRGVFDGKRILDEKLIYEASRKHISNCGSTQTPWLDSTSSADGDVDRNSDWGMGYGWQFWRCIPDGAFRGDGAFGQYCIVMPNQDAVMAVTAGAGDMQAMLFSIWNKLLPGISSSAENSGQSELDALLKSRALTTVQGEKTSPLTAKIDGATYDFSYRGTPFNAGFYFSGDTLDIKISAGTQCYVLRAGYGYHSENHLNFSADLKSYNPPFKFLIVPDIAASWAWNEKGTLIVKCVLTKYAYTVNLKLTADGDVLNAYVTMNIQIEEPFVLKGRRA